MREGIRYLRPKVPKNFPTAERAPGPVSGASSSNIATRPRPPVVVISDDSESDNEDMNTAEAAAQTASNTGDQVMKDAPASTKGKAPEATFSTTVPHSVLEILGSDTYNQGLYIISHTSVLPKMLTMYF